MVAVPEALVVVLTVKVAEVLPAVTVTLAGTVTLALLLERATTMPPVGAAPVNVTVPVELLPAATDVGFTETALSAAALLKVSPAVTLALL